jgi:hypothetical protein
MIHGKEPANTIFTPRFVDKPQSQGVNTKSRETYFGTNVMKSQGLRDFGDKPIRKNITLISKDDLESTGSQQEKMTLKAKMKVHARIGEKTASDHSKISNECFNLRLERKLPDSKSGTSFNTAQGGMKKGSR